MNTPTCIHCGVPMELCHSCEPSHWICNYGPEDNYGFYGCGYRIDVSKTSEEVLTTDSETD